MALCLAKMSSLVNKSPFPTISLRGEKKHRVGLFFYYKTTNGVYSKIQNNKKSVQHLQVFLVINIYGE